jgi:hypothetical protein
MTGRFVFRKCVLRADHLLGHINWDKKVGFVNADKRSPVHRPLFQASHHSAEHNYVGLASILPRSRLRPSFSRLGCFHANEIRLPSQGTLSLGNSVVHKSSFPQNFTESNTLPVFRTESQYAFASICLASVSHLQKPNACFRSELCSRVLWIPIRGSIQPSNNNRV